MSATSLYVDKDTVFHRLNGRATLALATGVSTAAYVFSDPLFVGLIFGITLGVLLYAGGWPNLLRVWYIIVALFIVGFVVWPAYVAARGPVVITTPVQLSMYELRFALGRSARIVTFLVAGLAFVTTTSNEEIVGALRALGLPFAFCFAIGTALRLFPTFLGAASTVKQAQEARGHDLSARNPVTKLRKYVPLLIPVFMTAFRQVSTQSMALEARGFDTRSRRTFYNRQRFRPADWAGVGVAALLIMGSVLLAINQIGRL